MFLNILISGCSNSSATVAFTSPSQSKPAYAAVKNADMPVKGQSPVKPEVLPAAPVNNENNTKEPQAEALPQSINTSVHEKIPVADKLILVNKWNPLSDKYKPDNLVRVYGKNNISAIPTKDKNAMLDAEALDAAVKMFKAAAADGINDLVLSSGYRSLQLQSKFYNNKVKQLRSTLSLAEAMEKAKTVVALPGTSEHHTGLAADFTTRELLKLKDPLQASFGETQAGKWLYANSWKYGYIIRYTEDKKSLTGVISEPWHLRYVGLPHSEIMYKNNLCLEEYVESLKQ